MVERRPEIAAPVESKQAVAPSAARPSLGVRWRDRDHTQGSLGTSIAVLALPSILTSVGGFGIFQLVDLWLLGQLGAHAVAAAGATTQTVRQFFFLAAFGISVASQMMISRMVGAGRLDGAEHVAGQTFLVGLGLCVVCAFFGELFPEFLARLVARDPEVIALATIYVRITFLTLFSAVFVQLFSAILNGAGDTTTPMLVSFLVTPISLVAEWALAFGGLGLPALGIAGIALGAAVGGLVGAAVSLWALFAGRCRVHLRRRHLIPDRTMMRMIAGLSWQPALHMLARSTITFFFMWLGGRLAGEVQAAYTIGLRIEMLAIMVAFPIANACATLVGQNLGAGDLGRAWRSIYVGFAVELALLWPLAVLLFVFRAPMVALFTSDPEVQRLATEYLAYSSAILVFYGLYFVSFRALQSAGDMNSPMLISVGAAVLLGAPLGYLLATHSELGATGMWIGNLAYAIANSLLMLGWLLAGRWTRRARAFASFGPPPGGLIE